ncbi:uncharacterized protein LOC106465369 [Limulus polyphemus]|uniref:Uncharacterized protein LOC106465369 n=1 Tax=Limulus polyphemus TaxID=6850 RepID=A0ABM1BFN2_LIMPO|nr:uncharacterized protein LOC106465369 [Limulus polyphemus]
MYGTIYTALGFMLIFAVSAIHIVSLHFPDKVKSGQELQLRCDYNLDGENLYSVKWYRDDMEFFRYVPMDNPVKQIFSLDGIEVDIERSNKDIVVLTKVTPTTEGIFRCEVSADAPSFQTVSAEKVMTIQVNSASMMKKTDSTGAALVVFFLWRKLLEIC